MSRTEQSVTRDAFDISVASEADAVALQIAVNSLRERQARAAEYNSTPRTTT